VPLNYRTEEEEQYYRDKDAIKHFEKTVTKQKLMTTKKLKNIRDTVEQEMLDAVEFGMNSPMPDASALYDDVYVNYSNPIPGLR
jgi:pyruvate dehydrogenase E1 component alpha subunit